ncbi:DUF4225 domain-containing protein [Pseudomonas sp. S2_F03]
MSIYSAGRLVLKPDAWRLFRYARTDYVRAYKNTHTPVLLLERTADTITTQGIYKEWKNKDRDQLMITAKNTNHNIFRSNLSINHCLCRIPHHGHLIRN